MTETPIVARPESPILPLSLLLLGVVGIGLGIALAQPVLFFSGFPLVVFPAVLLATRRKGIEFVLTDEGIDVLSPKPEFIPFHRLDSLSVADYVRPDRQRSFDILVSHERGLLTIPANCDVDSSEIYLYLRDRLPRTSEAPVPLTLLEHYQRQQSKFDPSRVFAFRASRRMDPPRSARGLWVALGFVFLGAAWAIAAVATEQRNGVFRGNESGKVFAGIGGLCVLGGLIATLIVLGRSRGSKQKFANWQGSGMVMSPIGLAMKQGPLAGKMRWEEISSIQWQKEGISIKISIPGSQIVVADIYNESIYTLYDLLWAFWRPPTASAADRRFQDEY